MEEVLNSPHFQKAIAELAQSLGKPIESIMPEVEECLKEMYATHNPLGDFIGMIGSQFLVSRGYDHVIDVDQEQLRRVAELVRSHSVAFVITHKTYLDTFVLSVVLGQNYMPIPYTFGGINMSFMGLGQLGRQAGAIFIRRSFKDNDVYKMVLRQYIAHLVRHKASFMWALEGTRSRTGKLLWPKLGILKYMMEASQQLRRDSVKYVPVSIVYDLIPDVHSMTAERTGSEKKPESLGWFVNYIRSMMSGDYGRITLRFGEPVTLAETPNVPEVDMEIQARYSSDQIALQKLAFELVHQINRATPVTTTSLVCTALLSKFAASKAEIDRDVAQLITIVARRDPKAVLSPEVVLRERVGQALELLVKDGVVERKGMGLDVRYTIPPESYLMAVYYSNMAIHHLVNHAFIELSLLHVAQKERPKPLLSFWAEMMRLRDLFKFEFYYPTRPQFSDEIEAELALIAPDWEARLGETAVLQSQPLYVAHAILAPYIEAYRVVAFALQQRQPGEPFDEERFIQHCIALGEELHWQGEVQRLEAISRPFLVNGIHLARNRGLIDNPQPQAMTSFLRELDKIGGQLHTLQSWTLTRDKDHLPPPSLAEILPETAVAEFVIQEVAAAPEGTHIGAFFDLDRTLIEGFSAKEFFQERLFSRTMTTREVVSQFAGVLVYAIGNRNFASLAAVSARGVSGTPESAFMELGEEVYRKHLADKIYPEARALVQAHLAKGHTVAIVSAATRYQVEPVARELNIHEVMCTRMEVQNGRFTGKIIHPPCWGEGKAYAANQLAATHNLDLAQSYFYTDSAEDLPLLEIVGRPRPLNPDAELDKIALERGWPIQRFRSGARPGMTNLVRTGLAFGSMVPALLAGVSTTLLGGSRRRGVNTMVATLGDLGTALAGIDLRVRGEEHMWSQRPAVFIFNHQSGADLLIGAKLLRKDATAIAKQELKFSLAGPLLMAGGVVFLDRANRKKAIEALEPAVEALRSGTSVAIAPEGTRSKDYRLGKFKKGAFHMAMQAGVPIVPMVIKNAHDAMPKGSFVIRPTTVEVVVLPPIPTTDWTLETLDDRIAEVRGLFLQELGQVEEGE